MNFNNINISWYSEKINEKRRKIIISHKGIEPKTLLRFSLTIHNTLCSIQYTMRNLTKLVDCRYISFSYNFLFRNPQLFKEKIENCFLLTFC